LGVGVRGTLLKTPKKLPVVLSPEEVTRLIEAAPNLFYRTLLLLLYATGLRRSEVAHLKVSDIDSSLMLIHVQQGKGSRDREVGPVGRGARAIEEVFACGGWAFSFTTLATDSNRHSVPKKKF